MRCEYCQKEFPVNDERQVGQEINCPHCGIPSLCSDRRVVIVCPSCHRDLEGELWMLGNRAECTYCRKEILLSRPVNPGDEFSNSYLPGNYILGNYTLKRCIGAGGMGEVYLAKHNLLEREYALKLLRPDRMGTVGDVSLEALIREARLACRIESPNIVSVSDVQVDPERNLGYIVMEYVKGRNIESMICEEPLEEAFVLEVAKGVCRGLIAAAAFDVVHRDIKPANIMLTDEGEVKLADLGIAKSGKEDTVSTGGKVAGTVNYAAPEQLLASDKADCRADIYSLGTTMYHMLSGRRPFDGQTTKAVMSRVLRGEYIPLGKTAPHVSKETCKLVTAMMSMKPENRPASAEKVLAALESICRKRSRNYLAFFKKWAERLSRKQIIWLSSSAAAVLIAAGVLIAALFFARDKGSEKLPVTEKTPPKVKTNSALPVKSEAGKEAVTPVETAPKAAEVKIAAVTPVELGTGKMVSDVKEEKKAPDPPEGQKLLPPKHASQVVLVQKNPVREKGQHPVQTQVPAPPQPVRRAASPGLDDVIPAGVEEFAETVKNTKAGRIAEKVIKIEMEKIKEEARAEKEKKAAQRAALAAQGKTLPEEPQSEAPLLLAGSQSSDAQKLGVMDENVPQNPKAAEPAKSAETAKPAEAAKPAEKTKGAVSASRGSTQVDFIRLLILLVWFLSGIKVMAELMKLRLKNDPFVAEYFELLNLAALVAGPIVWMTVVWKNKFQQKFKSLTAPKEVLPVIVDNHGKAVFLEGGNDNDGEVVYYVRKLLANALQLHASDIFLDPKTGDVSVLRFRVDGALRVIEELNFDFGNKVINVFKVVSGMDISERRRPQDGAFSLTGPFGEVSLRVASVGAFSGEKIALRILGDDSGPKSLAEAGLTGNDLAAVEQSAKLPSGMVLICGPTGSGKTTTLYAMLNTIDYSIKNVISIEDPIEHVIPAISQMEVNESAGIGFSQLLRNALRQNPDIICLGEIRDEDTAQTAIHAAQTGHLIIATLHSNDNIGTIDRLANLNIPLRSIAGTLRVVVSQRLVRKLCSCKKAVVPSEADKMKFKEFGIDCSKVFGPKGCPKCGNTGYSGRVALFDILAVNDELRELLEDEHTNLSNIQKRLKNSAGGSAMIRSGYALAAKGITSTDEVRRVTLEITN